MVIFACCGSLALFAQKNSVSPYSFYGIGESNKTITASQAAMGGMGVSLSDGYHLNLMNPAANSALGLTTYAVALESKRIRLQDANTSQNASTTHLSYLAVGIPLGNKTAFTFGLLPNTSVGYSLMQSTYDTDGTSPLESSLYEGTGGTNKVFFGLGKELFKGLSIALQGNYIFGNTQNSVIHQVTGVSLATKYENNATMNTFMWNAGLHYKTEIHDDLQLQVGANIDFENQLDAQSDQYMYSVSFSAYGSPRDTILSTQGTGTIKTPLKTTVGVGLGKVSKWYAGIDYSFHKPLSLEGTFYNNNSRVSYTDYTRLSLGGYYIPKFNSITSYWERISYRAGLKFEKSGLMVRSSQAAGNFHEINDFGISFGVGLPVSKQLSNLNFGLEFGKGGKTTDGLVEEKYIQVKCSFSMNDKWFNKRKIF